MDFHRNAPVPSPLPARGLNANAGASLQKDGIIFASASRTAAAYTSDEMHNPNCKGVRLYVDITDVGAAGTLTVKIQTKDPATGTWVDLAGAVTTALAAVATTTLLVYPGITETNNVDVSSHLGSAWRVVATVASNAVVFSIGGDYLL